MEISLTFPEGAAICAAGDYLVCHDPGEGWKVYRVEDLLLVKRLVPVLNDPSSLLIEEHLLDSMPPAYSNDVQLLLTVFYPGFSDQSSALRAIHHQALTEWARGLLRPAREFAGQDCRVVRQDDLTSAGTPRGSG